MLKLWTDIRVGGKYLARQSFHGNNRNGMMSEITIPMGTVFTVPYMPDEKKGTLLIHVDADQPYVSWGNMYGATAKNYKKATHRLTCLNTRTIPYSLELVDDSEIESEYFIGSLYRPNVKRWLYKGEALRALLPRSIFSAAWPFEAPSSSQGLMRRDRAGTIEPVIIDPVWIANVNKLRYLATIPEDVFPDRAVNILRDRYFAREFKKEWNYAILMAVPQTDLDDWQFRSIREAISGQASFVGFEGWDGNARKNCKLVTGLLSDLSDVTLLSIKYPDMKILELVDNQKSNRKGTSNNHGVLSYA